MNTGSARRRARQLESTAGCGGALETGRWSGAAGVTGGGLGRWGRRLAGRLKRSRAGVDEADHAALLEAMARALRSGLSTRAALLEAAQAEAARPAGAELARAGRGLEAGAALAEVVDDWMNADPGGARLLAATAVGLGAELGGAQARSLDAAAASLRDRAQLQREVRALTSQARASAWVMVLAPVAFAAYTAATDHQVARVLLASPIGWGCLVGGLALDTAGAGLMWRLARGIR